MCEELTRCSLCDAEALPARSAAKPVSRGDFPKSSRNDVVMLASGSQTA